MYELIAYGAVAALIIFELKTSKIRNWVVKRYASYTSDGKFWLTIGAVCLIVDMAIGYMAGREQATFWHGVGGAALAAGFAFFPDAAYEEYESKRWFSAGILTVLCAIIGVKAYEQQLTYTAGMRHGEVQLTNIVNAKHAGAQDNVSENKTNLDLWQKQLAKLQNEKAKAIEANPWMTSTKAEALREQVPELDRRIDAEAKGERGRPKGCKTVCEQLKDQKAKLVERIAGIEKMDGTTAEIAELTTKIESTKRVLDGARQTAATAEHRDSLNLAVAKTTAQLVKLVRGSTPEDAANIDAVALNYATLGSAGLGSLALLIMAPVGFFLAGRRRKHVDFSVTGPDTRIVFDQQPKEVIPSSSPAATTADPGKSHPSVHLARVTVGDLTKAALDKMLAGNAQKAAAA